MIQYRVTKYDPNYRDASGAFKRNEWIAHSQIGDTFDDGLLTVGDYLTAENAYVQAAVSFLSESGVNSLAIDSLENAHSYDCSALILANGHDCSLLEIADITRLVLRDSIWCKLVGDSAFLHFGWDYYMYIGVPAECPIATLAATESGLFVESFDSPHLTH